MKKTVILFSFTIISNLALGSTPLKLNNELREFHKAYANRDFNKIDKLRGPFFETFQALKERVDSGTVKLNRINKSDFDLAQNYFNSMGTEEGFSRVRAKYESQGAHKAVVKREKLPALKIKKQTPETEEDYLELDPPAIVETDVIEYILDNYYEAKRKLDQKSTPSVSTKDDELEKINLDEFEAQSQVLKNAISKEELSEMKKEVATTRAPIDQPPVEDEEEDNLFVNSPVRGEDPSFEEEVAKIKEEELTEIQKSLLVIQPAKINQAMEVFDHRDYLKSLKLDVIRVKYE